MKRVLFITYYWPPSGGAGVQRGLKFVKYLPEFGVEPLVLTVDTDQASYPSIDASLMADVPTDVRVIRTRSFEPLRILGAVAGKKAVPHAGFAGAKREGLVQRAMRWVRGNWMIPDARRGWVKHAVEAAAEVIAREKIGTIIISSPPHSSQLIGLELKKRFPALHWIADLRDPWTDIYFAKELMKGPRAERLDADWEGRVMTEADGVVVVGPSMKKSFAARYGEVVEKKITVIPNGYDADDMEPIKSVSPPSDRLRITYVGSMAASYEPRMFFEAIAGCIGAGDHQLELRFVGSVSEDIKVIAAQAGVGHLCTWVPTVSHEEALKEMAAAHVLLLVIPVGAGDERILTGKLFEYLGARRPIIGIGPLHGDAAVIINACEAGSMFERHQVRELTGWVGGKLTALRSREDLTLTGNNHQRYERRTTAEALARLVP